MKLLKLILLAAVIGGICSAATINGSMSLLALSWAENGTNLQNATTLTLTSVFVGSGTGDYLGVPSFTPVSNFTLNIDNLGAFSLTIPLYGVFQASDGSIITETASNLDVFLRGTFTPGVDLPGLSPTDTSLRISANKSGSSISGGITLNSPYVPNPTVPEPATLALTGGALVGIGIVGRKRFSKKSRG